MSDATPTSGSQAPHTFAAQKEAAPYAPWAKRKTNFEIVEEALARLCEEFAAIRQLSPPVPEAGANEALVESIMRWGGRCRDCADCAVLGVCDNSGLPCEPEQRREAIRHVLKAAAYYGEHPEFLAPVPEAPYEIVGVLERLERACDEVAELTSPKRYLTDLTDDLENALYRKDRARRAAREALSTLKAKADTKTTLPAEVHAFVSEAGLLATNHGGWFDAHGFRAISPLCDKANAILERYDSTSPTPSPAIPPQIVEALEPFAEVADWYGPDESDDFEVWADYPHGLIKRDVAKLRHFRNARAALTSARSVDGEGE